MKKLVSSALVPLILWAFLAGLVDAQQASQGWRIHDRAAKIMRQAISREDLLAARELLERAQVVFDNEKSPEGSGRVLYMLGCIDYQLGRYQNALDSFEKSLDFTSLSGDTEQEALNLNRVGEIYIHWGDYKKAMYYLGESLNIVKKIRSEKIKAAVLVNEGRVYVSWGNYEHATKLFHEALWIAKRIGDQRVEATALNNLGEVHGSLGLHGRALEYFEKSLDRSRRAKDPNTESAALVGVSSVLMARGRPQEALQRLQDAVEIAHTIGDADRERATLEPIGKFFASTGQYEAARRFFQNAMEISKKLGDVKNESANMCSLGEILVSVGQQQEALNYFKKALSIQEHLDVTLVSALNLIGSVLTDMKRFDEAEDYLLRSGNDGSLGRLYLLQSNYPESRKHYEKLLDQALRNRDAEDLYTAYTGLGHLYENQGELLEAEKHYEKGSEIAEQIRATLLPSERQAFLSARIKGFLRSDAAKGLTRVRMKLNKWEGAFHASEFTKARAFGDKLVQKDLSANEGTIDPVLRADIELASRIAALKKNYVRLSQRKDHRGLELIRHELQSAESDQGQLIEVLRQTQPRYASARYPRPVTVTESALGPEEYAVVYDCSEDGIAAWLLRGRKILHGHYLTWTSGDLERTIRAFRESFETCDLVLFDLDLAHSLYNKLLAPFIHAVPEGSPIVIVPDDLLALLPFDALVVEAQANWRQGPGEKYYPEGLIFVGDRHPISYYQSLTALTLVRSELNNQKPGHGLLVIADPVFDEMDDRVKQVDSKMFPKAKEGNRKSQTPLMREASSKLRFDRLLETHELAQRLKKIYGPDCVGPYTGFEADKNFFLTTIAPTIDRYGEIVFATHGLIDTRTPGIIEPFLALTLFPPGTDGFLGMSDVMSLNLNADVVALTACQTGLGQILSGEGIMSMGRAFQYAGARSVIMSLWKVDAKSSVRLIENFLAYRKDQAKTKWQALRLAREAIRREGFDHPFFWASFILVGETN